MRDSDINTKQHVKISENFSNNDNPETPCEPDKPPSAEPNAAFDTKDRMISLGQPQQSGVQYNNPRGNIQFLTVIGQVEGHMLLPPNNKSTKYEHVIPMLVMCAENPNCEGLLILLNTVGGDVEAGLAIAELISQLGKPTVSLVIGGGHSIGVPLAVAGNYSYIAPSATMTLHPVRLTGVVVGAQQTYNYFDKMQDRILEFIVRNSKITKKKLKTLMLDTKNLVNDVGTILNGKEAVEAGLIDETGGLYDALEMLYKMIADRRAANKINSNEGQVIQ